MSVRVGAAVFVTAMLAGVAQAQVPPPVDPYGGGPVAAPAPYAPPPPQPYAPPPPVYTPYVSAMNNSSASFKRSASRSVPFFATGSKPT